MDAVSKVETDMIDIGASMRPWHFCHGCGTPLMLDPGSNERFNEAMAFLPWMPATHGAAARQRICFNEAMAFLPWMRPEKRTNRERRESFNEAMAFLPWMPALVAAGISLRLSGFNEAMAFLPWMHGRWMVGLSEHKCFNEAMAFLPWMQPP